MKIIEHNISASFVNEFLVANKEKFEVKMPDGVEPNIGYAGFITMKDEADGFELEVVKFDEWRDALPNDCNVLVKVDLSADLSIYSKAWLVEMGDHPRHDSYYEQKAKIGTVLRSLQRYYSWRQLKDKRMFDWGVDKA